MRKDRVLFSVLAGAALLSGCSAMNVVQGLQSLEGARGAVGAYHASNMVKDAVKADPVFAGYEAVVPQAHLVPRDQDKADAIQAAFVGDLKYLLENDVRIIHAPLVVCATPTDAACAGKKILLMQFNEDDYVHTGSRLANIVNAVSVGDKLTGTLLYTDPASGAVVAQKKVEIAKNYGEVLQQIQGQTVAPMLKSFPQQAQDQQVANSLNDELPKLPVVAPQYQPLLGSAS